MVETLHAELVLSAQKGDPNAIEELLEKFRKPLFHYAIHYLGNESDAEDVTQEVLLKAVRALATFKGESTVTTWLYRIMVNNCIDYRRKAAVRPVSYLTYSNGDEDETVKEIKDPNPLPEEELEQIELRAVIKKTLNQLTPEHRTIIVLHDLQGFKYQEIAEMTKASLGTVKSRLFYARQELRKLLGPLLE
jgi:RNA polymerase sigma-70 factor (ECF subfamily)